MRHVINTSVHSTATSILDLHILATQDTHSLDSQIFESYDPRPVRTSPSLPTYSALRHSFAAQSLKART